jgi:hypothetical protein
MTALVDPGSLTLARSRALSYVALSYKRRNQAPSCLLGKHRPVTFNQRGLARVTRIGSSTCLWVVWTALLAAPTVYEVPAFSGIEFHLAGE